VDSPLRYLKASLQASPYFYAISDKHLYLTGCGCSGRIGANKSKIVRVSDGQREIRRSHCYRGSGVTLFRAMIASFVILKYASDCSVVAFRLLSHVLLFKSAEFLQRFKQLMGIKRFSENMSRSRMAANLFQQAILGQLHAVNDFKWSDKPFAKASAQLVFLLPSQASSRSSCSISAAARMSTIRQATA
jgi:hypothetical protein